MANREFKITSPNGKEIKGTDFETLAAQMDNLSEKALTSLGEQFLIEEEKSREEVEGVVRAYLESSKKLAQLEKELEVFRQKDMEAYLSELAENIMGPENKEDAEKDSSAESVPENISITSNEEPADTNEEAIVDNSSEEPTINNEFVDEKGMLSKEKEFLSENIRTDKDELEKTSWFKFGKRKKLKKSIENSKTNLQNVEKAEIGIDQKEKPLLYYAASKVTNTVALDRLLNKKLNSLDLRWVQDEHSYEGMTRFLNKLGPDEGFFEFNVFGFVKVIKNVKEITDDKGINIYGENAVYKILNPDGNVIAYNVKGYNEANTIYSNATEEYRKLIEKEFDTLSK